MGGEDVLPAPFAVRIGVFFFDERGQIDRAQALRHVQPVQRGGPFDLLLERRDEALREHCHVIGPPLPVTNDDLTEVKVDVANAQAETLDQAQPGAIDQLDDEAVDAREGGDHLVYLFAGQDGRGYKVGTFRTKHHHRTGILVQHLVVEKEQGGEGLLLGGSGDAAFHGQVDEKGFYFWRGHVAGVTFVVKEDEALDPIHVGMFSVNEIVFFAQDGAHTSAKLSTGLVQQLLLGAFRLCGHVFALRA